MVDLDATKVDPGHYTLESEDARVRVLRARYGPREKSVLHRHPFHVAVMLSPFHIRHSDDQGNSHEFSGNAGMVISVPAGNHTAENLGSAAFEAILIELKDG